MYVVNRLSGTRWAMATLSLLTMLWIPLAFGYTPDPNAPRSQVPQDYQWHPGDVFASDQAWEDEFTAVGDEIPRLADFSGKLGESAETLYDCLESTHGVLQRLYKLYVYASAKSDVDLDVDEEKARLGKLTMLFPTFSSTVSYIEPELLAIDPKVLDGFLAQHEGLKVYDYYIHDVLRMKPHTLSSSEERIMALAGNVMDAPMSVHEALMDVDLTFPEIVNEDGEWEQLTQTGFGRYRGSSIYPVRKQASDAFFGRLRDFENTYASMLDGIAKAHILEKDARGYDSCLEAALTPDDISTDAYDMLIDTIRANLSRTLHKYISLRKKVLGLDGPVTFANLYNPMVEGQEIPYSYDEGRALILKALKPLGNEYLGKLEEGMDPANGWIDVYPNKSKRSGAYSSGGAYDVHPFILHNFDDTLDAVFTTAHEFGHAMHSVYSNSHQPFVYSDYTTFLAEIASTCNEELLLTYLLQENKRNPDMKLYLLNQRLENIRLTIFRQTLFAEFEKRFHEHAESGEQLTADYLNELYAGLIKDYYGPDYQMGENDEVEWAFIPHFFYDFYVFTYATGLTSGISLAHQIVKSPKAAQRYETEMLSAGSSAPPLDILRNAGVDLESPEPILEMLDLFEATLDEFDRVWTRTYGP